jgi:hypothetical protein
MQRFNYKIIDVCRNGKLFIVVGCLLVVQAKKKYIAAYGKENFSVFQELYFRKEDDKLCLRVKY